MILGYFEWVWVWIFSNWYGKVYLKIDFRGIYFGYIKYYLFFGNLSEDID